MILQLPGVNRGGIPGASENDSLGYVASSIADASILSISEQFEQQGFLVQRALLDPAKDLEPLRQVYTSLTLDLARIYLREARVEIDVEKLSPAEQFCVMLGASRGKGMHHLDPALNIFADGYEWRPDLPDPRPPELFQLMTRPRLLDALEELIGPEITATPIYHLNQKPAAKHMQLADELARQSGMDIARNLFYNFQVGRTGWHMDAIAGLPDSHDSNIVNAWVPLTAATAESGCLMVIPGSHKFGVRFGPYPTDQLDEKGVKLPVEPGDVIFLHNRTMHCSVANTSDDGFRCAFNTRYLPTGQPTGRPYLPEFVARSRKAPGTELHDPETWRLMWARALDYIAEHGAPTTYAEIRNLGLADAQRLTRHWQELVPDPEAWLKLGR